jgi:hypothetical protein
VLGRDGAGRLLLTGEDRELLGAAGLLVTAWLFELLPLDLLLRALFAVTVSASNIKAEIIIKKTNLSFVVFFSVNMACLLNLFFPAISIIKYIILYSFSIH